MEDPKLPNIATEKVPQQDDTQLEILKQLKRQNALLEEQLAPQREQKRKEEAYRIQMEKERQYRRFISFWEFNLKKLVQERTQHSQQLQNMEQCPQWFKFTLYYDGKICDGERRQAKIHNEGVAKRIKDHQDKVESLTKKINNILSGVLKGKYRFSTGGLLGSSLLKI